MTIPRLRWPAPGVSLAWGLTITWLSLIILVPLSAVVVKASGAGWGVVAATVTNPIALASLKLSFGGALFAALVNAVMGTLIAWVLVRYDFPGKSVLNAIVDMPFALPTAVAGITLSELFSPRGWMGGLGSAIESWSGLSAGALGFLNLRFSYTQAGVLLAMVFISLPFVIRTVQPVLQELEREVEEAAECLGASSWQIFAHVILPSLRPAILTGLALGFARAVGEYGSVVIISGNIPMKTLVAPVLIYQKIEEYDQAGAAVVATVMLLASVAILAVINVLQMRRGGERA